MKTWMINKRKMRKASYSLLQISIQVSFNPTFSIKKGPCESLFFLTDPIRFKSLRQSASTSDGKGKIYWKFMLLRILDDFYFCIGKLKRTGTSASESLIKKRRKKKIKKGSESVKDFDLSSVDFSQFSGTFYHSKIFSGNQLTISCLLKTTFG